MYCWNCGDDNPDDYRFCGRCGTPARGAAPHRAGVPHPPPREMVDLLSDADATGTFTTSSLTRQTISFSRSFRNGSELITVTDGAGPPRTFASVEEMPADVRMAYERMMDYAARHHAPNATAASRASNKYTRRDGAAGDLHDEAVGRAVIREILREHYPRSRSGAHAYGVLTKIAIGIGVLLMLLWLFD